MPLPITVSGLTNCHDRRRAERGRFERDLPGDTEQDGPGEADIIDRHRLTFHVRSRARAPTLPSASEGGSGRGRARTEGRSVCGSVGAVRITDLTTDCGFRLAVR